MNDMTIRYQKFLNEQFFPFFFQCANNTNLVKTKCITYYILETATATLHQWVLSARDR